MIIWLECTCWCCDAVECDPLLRRRVVRCNKCCSCIIPCWPVVYHCFHSDVTMTTHQQSSTIHHDSFSAEIGHQEYACFWNVQFKNHGCNYHCTEMQIKLFSITLHAIFFNYNDHIDEKLYIPQYIFCLKFFIRISTCTKYKIKYFMIPPLPST